MDALSSAVRDGLALPAVPESVSAICYLSFVRALGENDP
jgi:hypothetical protein